MRIGIDLMGGDRSPMHIFQALLEGDFDHEFVVLADATTIKHLERKACFEFVMTEEMIEMGESPLYAIRRKKKASMAIGMKMLKDKQIDALVSTGNTGALVASAMIYLTRLPRIERPALLVMMPNGEKGVVVLDVGANITPKPQHLIDYAKMAAVYRSVLHGITHPKVGLLNIGVEERKGTKEVQQTYRLLQEEFREGFLGNIEGREVFDGDIDIMVTDGFTGNVFLKTCEGVSSFFMEYIQEHFPSAESKKIVEHFYHRFNYDKHPGAFLCGVDGIVVKCHGYSNQTAMINGIKSAIDLAENQITDKLKQALML